jgi:hypothetical protein
LLIYFACWSPSSIKIINKEKKYDSKIILSQKVSKKGERIQARTQMHLDGVHPSSSKEKQLTLGIISRSKPGCAPFIAFER